MKIFSNKKKLSTIFVRSDKNKINTEKSTVSLNILKNILNGMDAYLYVSDMQTDEILFINDRMKEHFQLSDDPIGSICWKVLQTGLEQRCEFCPNHQLMQDPDTPVVWEEHNTVTERYYKNIDCIIEWSNGNKVHLQHSTDITDIKMVEASLKKRLKQQELMSTISQSFTTTAEVRQLIYAALKMAGEFMNVNQAFLSKHRKDEGVLECLYEWYDEEGRPFIGNENKWPITPDMEIYKDLTVNGYAAINDFFSQVHPNFETVKEYELRAFFNIPIEVSGEFWGILGFIINKSTYNWNESDIHLGKLIAGVFSGVISRNIVEENLIKAKETAEHASRAKGDFLSRMSHEMRTPMNAIIGMTGIARNSKDPEKKEYCLEKIDNASKHLLGVINDILDISKIEADKFELSPTEFEFEKMLINITSVINFRAEEKKQNFIVNVDESVSSVLIGDEMRLSQVITNLLTNAIKFTAVGGTVVLNVHKQGESDGVSTLFVEVIDNGIGISEEQQIRLFTSFEQADGSTARKYGGTGLGLAICKKIVELMDGRIWIESELGQGAKFIFTVKMKTGKATPRASIDKVLDRDSIRILAVDDSKEVRDYFTHVMSEMGLSCDAADGGAMALKMIEENRDKQYNVFFIDWIMPDLNGIELTKKIKQIIKDNVIIIMISVSDWSDIEKEAIAAGVDSFISKPLFPSTLMNALNESMGVAPMVKINGEKSDIRDFKGYTLLLAEDVEINREIISAILEGTKISIDYATNGVEAFSQFEKNPDKYSLILMDIHMPEMDGYEATNRIRSLERAEAKSIPIIAMTANVFREDVERCLQAGMNDHIGKPVDTEVLLSKLDKYLPPKDIKAVRDMDDKPILIPVRKPENEYETCNASSTFRTKFDGIENGISITGPNDCLPEKKTLDYMELLPVLDLKDGLRRVMGNKNLYFKLLGTFSGMKLADNLIESIKNSDFPQMELNAHTLKGVSANLGLAGLHDVVREIESRAKSGAEAKDFISLLNETTDATILAINALLESEDIK